MKVEAHSIGIQVSMEEWELISKEWEKLRFADKPKVFEHKNYPNLFDFMTCVDMIFKNPAHKIDKTVNKY